MSDFPVPNTFVPHAVWQKLPNNLWFKGRFTAFMAPEELATLRARLGDTVPELPPQPDGVPKNTMRQEVVVRLFDRMTGREIAAILGEFGYWRVDIGDVLYIPA